MDIDARSSARRRTARLGIAAVALAIAAASPVFAQKSAFDLRDPLVPAERILPGGPPKDGIPSIDSPRFVAASAARFLANDDWVLAMKRNGIAKAYPIRILNWHEVVNDRFGDEPIAVTWCPLCGSGMAFSSRVGDRTLSFGVSGLLYNSDVLLYDRQTESLWTQIGQRAVSGAMKGTRLQSVPVLHTRWDEWRRRHPDTVVLSPATGFIRSYGVDPYAGYDRSPTVFFPLEFRAEGFHPKERVLGVEIGGRAKAYPFVELASLAADAAAPVEFADRIGDTPLKLRFDPGTSTAEAFGPDGEPLAATTLFWFAWYAFHPQTEIFRAR